MSFWDQLSERVTCHTPLPPEAFMERLEPWVEKPKSIRGGIFSVPDYRKYEGVLQNQHFRLCRIVRGRTIVTPIVSGRILPTDSGSRVEATVHLRRRTWIILGVVAVVLLAGSVLSWMGFLEGTEGTRMPYLTGPLFLVALFLVLQTQVKQETKAFLRTIERLKEKLDNNA